MFSTKLLKLAVDRALGKPTKNQGELFEELYKEYSERGLVILGFPCNQFGKQEAGSDDDINSFCQVNYGVSFPIFSKIEVKGPGAHPLFQYMTKVLPGFLGKPVKWNFSKFLFSPEGKPVKRFAFFTKPHKLKRSIEKLLTS